MYKKDENWVSFLGSVAMQNITVCCIQPKTEHPHYSPSCLSIYCHSALIF